MIQEQWSRAMIQEQRPLVSNFLLQPFYSGIKGWINGFKKPQKVLGKFSKLLVFQSSGENKTGSWEELWKLLFIISLELFEAFWSQWFIPFSLQPIHQPQGWQQTHPNYSKEPFLTYFSIPQFKTWTHPIPPLPPPLLTFNHPLFVSLT